MFNSKSGLFHLIFANQEDDYYTPSYVKMKFRPFLLSQLRAAQYAYLYTWEKAFDMASQSYLLQTIGGPSLEVYAQPRPKERLIDRFWRKKNKPQPEIEESTNDNAAAVYVERSKVADYFLRLLDFADDNGNTAIIIPLDLFLSICDERHTDPEAVRQIVGKLATMRSRRSNSNGIILLSSVHAAENDLYFRNPELERGAGLGPGEQENILFHKKVFPEIYGTFNNPATEKIPKLVFHYQLLRECLGERMQCWNELGYYQILTIVKYTMMRTITFDRVYPPELYAAIIWSWYENEEFREKYQHILSEMPENPFRLAKNIAYIIEKQLISPAAIQTILHQEDTDQSETLRSKWPADGPAVCITYGASLKNVGEFPKIVQQMLRLRQLLRIRNHPLSDEDLQELSALIRYFSTPVYQSSVNKADLPHLLFYVDEYDKVLEDTMRNLEKKPEWNIWDDCTVQILLLLFQSCRSQAEQRCQEDLWNELGQLIFKKSREGLYYCLEQSRETPYQNEKACGFIADFSACIRSWDKKRIREFLI